MAFPAGDLQRHLVVPGSYSHPPTELASSADSVMTPWFPLDLGFSVSASSAVGSEADLACAFVMQNQAPFNVVHPLSLVPPRTWFLT